MRIIKQGTPPDFSVELEVELCCPRCDTEYAVTLGECIETGSFVERPTKKTFISACPVCAYKIHFVFNGRTKELDL